MLPDQHRDPAPLARLWGHDPSQGEDGSDVLVEVWADRTTVAFREGKNETWHSWGPPIELKDAHLLERVDTSEVPC